MLEIIVRKDLSLADLPKELNSLIYSVEKQSDISAKYQGGISFICLGNLLINDEKPELLQNVNDLLSKLDAILYVMRGDLDKTSSFPNVIGRVILVSDIAVLPTGTVLISPGTGVHRSKPMKLDGDAASKLVDVVATKVILNIDYIDSFTAIYAQQQMNRNVPESNILSLELDYIDSIISCLEATTESPSFKVFTYSHNRNSDIQSSTTNKHIYTINGGEFFFV